MVRARRRLTGAQVAGPFSYHWARPWATRRILDPPVLSREAKERLAWMDLYVAHGENAALTSRHFAISRATFYRWKERFDPCDLTTLEDRSRAPRRRRTPTTPASVIDLVLAVRDERPAWSKHKIAVVLSRDFGTEISASTVGRILSRYGRIEKKASSRRRKAALSRKRRNRRPKDLSPSAPGELVQMDTKHLNLPWSEKRGRRRRRGWGSER